MIYQMNTYLNEHEGNDEDDNMFYLLSKHI